MNRLTPILGLAFFLIGIALLGCAGNSSTTDYAAAVEKVSSSAIGLTIKAYTTDRQIVLDKEHPEFSTVTNYIKQSNLSHSQPR